MQALPPGPAPAPRNQLLVGTGLGVLAMVMMVGGMIAVWALQRTRSIDLTGSWVPEGVVIPEVASNVMLLAFVGVCVFAQWAQWSGARGDRAHTAFAFGALALVALMIINAQAFIYHEMGLGIGDGTYAVMFYAITGVFVALMVVGLAFTAVVAFRSLGGRVDGELLVAHAIFWYAVAVVYAGIWLAVYVVK
ncbi:MAG: cytochrome c oxidase subunit 3 [Ilumatobacteraceae bacterium]